LTTEGIESCGNNSSNAGLNTFCGQINSIASSSFLLQATNYLEIFLDIQVCLVQVDNNLDVQLLTWK